ncbi:MAG: hypothetical protein HUU47_07910 [Bacteroidetes bacterium]|nr:hypothetical protein [Bacteroidota bacterium]
MIIKNLADNLIYPLKSADTVRFALESFEILKQEILPVIESDELLGFVFKNDILKINSSRKIRSFVRIESNFVVNENFHFFEAINIFYRYKIPFLITVNNQNQYTGNISIQSILNYLASSYTLQAEGSVINIKVLSGNYSLNELNRIIESEDAKIIGLEIFKIPETSLLILNIKLNTLYIDRIVFSLQRFGYEITDTFFNRSIVNDVEDRYQSLVKFLEL